MKQTIPLNRIVLVRVALSAAAVLLLAGTVQSTQAQVGSGWTQYSASKTIQQVGSGAYYNNSGGVETFRIQPGNERSEARIHNDYSSGQRQFEGEIKLKSGSDGVTVQQVFGGSSAATAFQMRGYNQNGGTLRRYTSAIIGENLYGTWKRINVIHDASANTVTVYRQGTLIGTYSDSGNATHYFKYGVYGGSASNPESQWRNIKFFRK